jgi:hypothetical protein
MMPTLRENYVTAYRSLKLTWDAEGVLFVQFPTNAGPFIPPRRTIVSSSMPSNESRRTAQTGS